MDELLLHHSTLASLQKLINEPSHAICLVGPLGAGKGYLAHALAKELLTELRPDAIYTLGDKETNVSIEDVRKLQHILGRKQPGQGTIKRVIIMEHAETMGPEAQNALLKMLEEPPADTVFILTTDGSNALKSTIYSRLQPIRILPVGLEVAISYFSDDSSSFKRLYALSGGNVGLLHALKADPDHKLVEAITKAKELMAASSFDKLTQIDILAKQKDDLPTLLYALQRVLAAALGQTTDRTALKRLTSALRSVQSAQTSLQNSANTKLLLNDLFLHL